MASATGSPASVTRDTRLADRFTANTATERDGDPHAPFIATQRAIATNAFRRFRRLPHRMPGGRMQQRYVVPDCQPERLRDCSCMSPLSSPSGPKGRRCWLSIGRAGARAPSFEHDAIPTARKPRPTTPANQPWSLAFGRFGAAMGIILQVQACRAVECARPEWDDPRKDRLRAAGCRRDRRNPPGARGERLRQFRAMTRWCTRS